MPVKKKKTSGFGALSLSLSPSLMLVSILHRLCGSQMARSGTSMYTTPSGPRGGKRTTCRTQKPTIFLPEKGVGGGGEDGWSDDLVGWLVRISLVEMAVVVQETEDTHGPSWTVLAAGK